MKKRFLFISCEEAKLICDKVQYKEATGWERIKLGLRLSWCKITKTYSSNNKKLTDYLGKSSIDCMTLDEKGAMQKLFEAELTKYQK